MCFVLKLLPRDYYRALIFNQLIRATTFVTVTLYVLHFQYLKSILIKDVIFIHLLIAHLCHTQTQLIIVITIDQKKQIVQLHIVGLNHHNGIIMENIITPIISLKE